ncbi:MULTISPECIES: NUDIX domain-containing protein [unclassified Imperialibacter]|uniref:NUDIX domain-containing protein n=1 Tax=unclassified Imperialibacter TaxID=2629706 RepID=UPI001256B8EF|nr:MULTISPECIES: NUDIX hydrolase [unclassified Imperialibacter]CAD5280849.1 NUDIX hydrolase [Imperialibacter sp. 75]CAD5284273.1 NUDIX hydrolase [Imperialibacter sp. 89]VVT28483.1 NUDIX hydrolase [Imperialibacter sp. EC-SDR9]
MNCVYKIRQVGDGISLNLKMDVSQEVERLYGHEVRTRVCGICFREDKLLLIKHLGLTSAGFLWAPPGGGVQYGTNLETNLIREFKEETGLYIEVVRFLFVYEYVGPPLQTIELFFEVRPTGGDLCRGVDPEMSDSQQIIDEVRFVSLKELNDFAPESLHHMLKGVHSKEDLLRKTGFFKFEKN